MSMVLFHGQFHFRRAARWLIGCVALVCLVEGRTGWGDDGALGKPDDIEFVLVGNWQDKEIPRADPDSVYTFQVAFTVAIPDAPKTFEVPAVDLKGDIPKGDRLLLTGYSNPKNGEVTFGVFAMTPSAERLVAELSALPAEAMGETCCGRLAIPICASQLRSEDLATRIIARFGFVGWTACAHIQSANDIAVEMLQKLSSDETLGRSVHETAALLLASKSPAAPTDIVPLIHRLRDSGSAPDFFRNRILSQAYLAALREKGISPFLSDEKWGDAPTRRKLVHVAIDELDQAKRPLDRNTVLAFCEESLKLDRARTNGILTLQKLRHWDVAPRLKEMFLNGPFSEESRSIELRLSITNFVLTWRDSVDPASESYRQAVKTLEEFERIDAEAVEFSKANYRPPSEQEKGC